MSLDTENGVTMSPEIFLLILLQIKHWYIDFVDQTDKEILSKKIYGDKFGIHHSIKHGAATTVCVEIVLGFPGFFFAVLMGLLDIVAHYHIDYIKSNYGCADRDRKLFWNHFGLDQLAHQITYIAILGLTLL